MIQKIQNVMLIDDEEVDQRQYQRIMKRSGLISNIISFTMALDAIEYLKNNRSVKMDVILLDINMPKMNGFEFLEQAQIDLGEDFANMVIIMLTTSLNPSDRERARSFTVVREFINKPLTLEDVKYIASSLSNP